MEWVTEKKFYLTISNIENLKNKIYFLFENQIEKLNAIEVLKCFFFTDTHGRNGLHLSNRQSSNDTSIDRCEGSKYSPPPSYSQAIQNSSTLPSYSWIHLVIEMLWLHKFLFSIFRDLRKIFVFIFILYILITIDVIFIIDLFYFSLNF